MTKLRNVISGLLSCLLVSGCSLYEQAARTLWCEPALYNACKDDRLTQENCCMLANRVWNSTVCQNPATCSSPEFEKGFKDGFADYVYAGGTGAPPPVPPRCFWNLDCRTPKGHQVVEDWFAGFRRGAAAAREGGYRQVATTHSSLGSDPDVPNRAPCVPTGPDSPPEEIAPPVAIPLDTATRQLPPERKARGERRSTSSDTESQAPRAARRAPQRVAEHANQPTQDVLTSGWVKTSAEVPITSPEPKAKPPGNSEAAPQRADQNREKPAPDVLTFRW